MSFSCQKIDTGCCLSYEKIFFRVLNLFFFLAPVPSNLISHCSVGDFSTTAGPRPALFILLPAPSLPCSPWFPHSSAADVPHCSPGHSSLPFLWCRCYMYRHMHLYYVYINFHSVSRFFVPWLLHLDYRSPLTKITSICRAGSLAWNPW